MSLPSAILADPLLWGGSGAAVASLPLSSPQKGVAGPCLQAEQCYLIATRCAAAVAQKKTFFSAFLAQMEDSLLWCLDVLQALACAEPNSHWANAMCDIGVHPLHKPAQVQHRSGFGDLQTCLILARVPECSQKTFINL